MTATGLINFKTGASPDMHAGREGGAGPRPAFAKVLEAAQRSEAGANVHARHSYPPILAQSIELGEAVLRFDETSVFGRPEPADERIRLTPALLSASSLGDASVQTLNDEPTSPPQAANVAERRRPGQGDAAPTIQAARQPNTHALTQRPTHDSTASPARPTPPAYELATEHTFSPQASTPARAPAPRQYLSAVLVALHATEAELVVYARPGRMAPTERERLRNAIAALLSEYGLSNATVRLDDEGVEASHG